MLPHFFYSTPLAPCPYLSGKFERKIATELKSPWPENLHNALSRAGFRRSHGIAYVPACPDCSACIPTRINVSEFRPDRTMRRVLARNADLSCVFAPPIATDEHFTLFAHYQKARHATGDMVQMTDEDYRSMIEESPIKTYLVEYRGHAGELLATCLTDQMDDGLSAVYSYYTASTSRRSLGTYMILSLIDHARRLKLPYVYLGFWIQNCRKMAYKSRFSGLEGYLNGQWTPLQETPLR